MCVRDSLSSSWGFSLDGDSLGFSRRGVLSGRGFSASLSTAIRRAFSLDGPFSFDGAFSLGGASLSAAVHLPFSLDGVFVYFDYRTVVSSKAIADSK
ncbi:hypothetical protein DY000_02005618 [Brassica cretica]|uniref:Uncharacterized protein n=1 Tax=Brassica cretica TaxID=69181 RepID=A0ABQ7C9Q0_BRACR|nr:hypothetical protein DY000_02005618 [Brassica cretica]